MDTHHSLLGFWAEMRRRWQGREELPSDSHIRSDIGLPAQPELAMPLSPLLRAWLR